MKFWFLVPRPFNCNSKNFPTTSFSESFSHKQAWITPIFKRVFHMLSDEWGIRGASEQYFKDMGSVFLYHPPPISLPYGFHSQYAFLSPQLGRSVQSVASGHSPVTLNVR